MRVFTMRLATFISLSILGSFLIVTEASANPGRGVMGVQSRAEVLISVSVLPRFKTQLESKSKDAKKDPEGILRPINAPSLRYSVVRIGSENDQSLGSSMPRDGMLIVVPD
jgi:hypothetical protein